MRLILRNHQCYRIWNVKDYIQQIQSNNIAQDNQQYIAIQNIFHKVYLHHLNDHAQMIKHKANLTNYVLASQAPAKSIAEYFHRKSRTYSQVFLKITLQSLAQGYRISKMDNNGNLDAHGYKLFLSSQFQNITQQFKYGLKHNKISFSNLISMLESFLKLQYLDYEIIQLLILYTKREIENGDQFVSLSNWSGDRQYQIEKRSYYNPNEGLILQGLKQSQQLKTAISFVRQIHKEWVKSQEERIHLRGLKIEQLNRLIEQIGKTNNNFRKLVQGILSIRRQYLKMVSFSRNQLILRNPNLNIELLELEQKLISIKLLNITDIKNPDIMNDANYQVKRVQQILLIILKVQRLDPLLAFVDKNNQQIGLKQQSQGPQPHRIGLLLSKLAKFASLDRHLYHSKDGRSLINMKWQKTLIFQERKMGVSHQEEELNVSRIFRRVFGQITLFCEQNIDKIDKIFKRSLLSQKLLLIEGYLTIGFNELSIAIFNQIKNQQLQTIRSLSQQQFVRLVAILNNIGIFIENPALKAQVLQKLDRMIQQQENNISNLGLQTIVNVVNYLIQNHRQEEQYSSLYQRTLDILQIKVMYYTPLISQNQNLVDGVKILAVERPHKFLSHPVYVNYLREMTLDNYKRNVYHAILRQAGHKWAGRIDSLQKMQPFLSLGFNKGILNGIYFSNSEETSLDGSLRSGNLNAQIIRLQLKNNMRISEFSTNSFLELNYRANKGSNLFKLVKIGELEQRLQQIYDYQPQVYERMFDELHVKLKQTLEAYPSDLIANRIQFKLAVLARLRNNQIENVSKENEYSSKVQFLLQLLELNKLVQLLDEKLYMKQIVKKTVDSVSINQKLSSTSVQDSNNIIEIQTSSKSSLKNMIKALIDQTNNYINQQNIKSLLIQSQYSNKYLQGNRQSIELLSPSNQDDVKDITPYFINRSYYNDKTYCQYGDWKEAITKKYNIAQLEYQKLTNLTKILAQKFCGNVKNTIGLMPICRHDQRYKRLKMQFKLLDDKQEDELSPQISVKEKELDYIINLQNFKHQLKTQFSQKQLIQYIFSFTFVNDLNPKFTNRNELLIHRDPIQYFQYLEDLNEQLYIQSPYACYILSKISSTSHIKQLLDQRKDLRLKLKIQYQQGKINGLQYFSLIDGFQQKILNAVKQLRGKLLDYTKDSLIENEFKMVKIKKQEIEAFEQLIHKQISYSRNFDQDFIYSNGNYEKALQLRRGRAQSNYIKFYLIKKVMENKQLNVKQKEWANTWHTDIIKSLNSFIVFQKYTTLQISQLPWQDLNKLQLKNTSLKPNRDMLLIDLILQFDHFLDRQLINAYETQIKAEHLANKHNIPHKLFMKSNSFAFKKIDVEVQAAIQQEKSKFNDQDIDRIIDLFQIYKVEGRKQRNRYQDICKNLRGTIKEMNKQIIRNQLIQQYLKELNQQFLSDYNGSLIDEIKEKEIDKLWRQIFKQKYDNCKTIPLKEAVRKIILRLQIIGKNPPPFFGNLLINLLQHPNIDSITRQSLIVAIQLNKFNLNLDSCDIKRLSQVHPKSSQEAASKKTELEECVNVNISSLLKRKFADALQ